MPPERTQKSCRLKFHNVMYTMLVEVWEGWVRRKEPSDNWQLDNIQTGVYQTGQIFPSVGEKISDYKEGRRDVPCIKCWQHIRPSYDLNILGKVSIQDSGIVQLRLAVQPGLTFTCFWSYPQSNNLQSANGPSKTVSPDNNCFTAGLKLGYDPIWAQVPSCKEKIPSSILRIPKVLLVMRDTIFSWTRVAQSTLLVSNELHSSFEKAKQGQC